MFADQRSGEGLDSGKISRRLLFGLAVSAVLLINAAIFLVPGNRVFKDWRARQLSREALVAMEKDDFATAAQKTIASVQLSPKLPEVARSAARLSLKLATIQAVILYKNLLASDGWQPEDLLDAEEAALAAGDLQFFQEIAQKIPQDLRKGNRYETLQIEYLLSKNDLAGAMQSAREAIRVDPATAKALSPLLLNFGDETDVARAREYFEQMARQGEPAVSRDALRTLMNSERIPPAQRLAFSRTLAVRSDAELSDHLAGAAVEIAVDPVSRVRVVQSLIDQYSAVPDSRGALSIWLVRHGELAMVEKILPLSLAFSRKDYFLIWLDTMAGQKRWEDVGKVLKRNDVPLEAPYLFLFRGRADSELGDALSAERNYGNAVDSARDEPATLAYLAGYFSSIKQKEFEARSLQKMASIPSSARYAYEALLNLHQGEKDSSALLKCLKAMAELWPNDLAVQNDATYLKLLFNEDVGACAAKAWQRHQSYPQVFPFSVTCAFGLLRSGEPAKALAQFENSKVALADLLPGQKAIFAAVLAGNGLREGAADVAATIPPGTLTPEEESVLKEYLSH